MSSYLFRNVQVWDGQNDVSCRGEVVVEGNRIRTVTRGANQISTENAAEAIDGGGRFLMPGLPRD